MSRVAVSILNHNNAEGTIACVKSLIAAKDVVGETCQLEIFVADNHSQSPDQDQLHEFCKESSGTYFHANDENLGFAVGHNRNLQLIFNQSKPEFVWLLNNDCLVSEGSLHALITGAQQNPDIGIWGATLLEPDGKTIQCAGGCFYNTWISSYRQYGRGKPLSRLDQLETVDFDYIAGASLFFPVATLLDGLHPVQLMQVGKSEVAPQWLNESFFLYFEELDLAKRLKPGLRMAWCRAALIEHLGGVKTGALARKRAQLAEYHSTLSALKFTRLYYPRRLWFMAIARYFIKGLLLLVKMDFRQIGMMTKAHRDFWRSA